jgi:transcriptional regulator with XRE-family HTH domain
MLQLAQATERKYNYSKMSIDNTFYSKIKQYRKEQNLTIKELAEQVQITASMLSQIERGLANPSINTMKVIAQALNIPLFKFFLDDDRTNDLVVTPATRKRISLPHAKGIDYELLTPDLNGVIEFCQFTLDPQKTSSDKPMNHSGEEVALILEGVAHLCFDHSTVTLQAGDSIRIPPETNHKWFNPTEQPLVLVFAITPPTF